MITLTGLTKVFGDATAVNGIDMEIADGEFFSMLGPSGCGKTTTLRMIAGFEEPTSGRIELAGKDVTWTSPRRRNVNMVFQNYALFPHMTVRENVEFGLRIKKLGKAEARGRIERMIAAVRMEGFESRHPAQLSGGQQQRVALARALVNQPEALLLDEPLGALDLKLRKEMQLELKSIQQQTGTTFVYVTHDQEEALTMSDRVAVMNGGNVEQVDDPRSLYEQPRSEFVADFIGTSNLLTIEVDEREGDIARSSFGDGLQITCREGSRRTDTRTIIVRPEKINVHATPVEPGQGSQVRGRIVENVYLGSMTKLIVELDRGDRLIVHELNDDNASPAEPGTGVYLSWGIDHSFVIDPDTGHAEPVAGPA